MDEYKSIKITGEGFYKEKGSKFIATAYHVQKESNVKEILDELWRNNNGACHVCYAWVMEQGNQIRTRAADDGEPSNSAGKPILGQIEAFGLVNTLVAVVRFYGGTNLGVGGLMQAYKAAAHECLEKSEAGMFYPSEVRSYSSSYEHQPFIRELGKKYEARFLEENYTDKYEFKVEVPVKHLPLFEREIEKFT